jgi:hypothetical protein
MIPPPSDDINEAWRLIGQKEMRIVQLMQEMMRRADEANELHDSLLAMQQRVKELEDAAASPTGDSREVQLLKAKIEDLWGQIEQAGLTGVPPPSPVSRTRKRKRG